MGVRIGGITLPDLDAEAVLALVNLAIDALPDSQKPRTEDDWVVHLEIKPSVNEATAVLLWDWPPAPITWV